MKRKILLSLGAVVLVVLILFGSLMLKLKSEEKKLTPLATQTLTHDVSVVKDDFSNVYIVQCNSGYVVIDAGTCLENVQTELSTLNIDPLQVKAVLLTHTDMDHVQSLELFSKAKVYLSNEEEQMINGQTNRMFCFGNHIATRDYILLEEGEELIIDNLTIKGILVPGHTPGHMAFVINDHYLFSSDAVGLKDGQVVPFNEFFNMDTPKAMQSMSKLVGLEGVQYIFTAHHGYTDDYKKAVIGINL